MWISNLDISKDIKEYDGISYLDKHVDIKEDKQFGYKRI